MKFSVLMSVYKNDNTFFFKQALESISINQTLKPQQIVIVKDGPVNDDIDNVIDNIKAKAKTIEISVITKKNNVGLAAALNTGISECKYDLIARMDSDDISLCDRFQKQVSYLEANSNIDVLGGSIAEFTNTPGDMKSERHVNVSHEEIVKMAKKRTPMNHVSVLFKKNAIIKVGGYSENFGKLEDYKLWVDLISNGYKMANLEDVLVNVRVGNGFVSRRSNKREIKDWDMLQQYLLKQKIINSFEAIMNKCYIRIFIYMPGWLKKLTYKFILRKK